MSQHDLDITSSDANTGPTMRAAINDALQALGSLQSGSSAPSTTYPNMFWIDTGNSLLKKRDNADTTWLIVGSMDTIYLGLANLAAANTFSGINTFSAANIFSGSNEFQASQHLDGAALLWRFRDTGGNEWGIRSNGNNLEVCENTNTELSPTWTVRLTVGAGGITHADSNTSSTLKLLSTPTAITPTIDGAWHAYTVNASAKMAIIRINNTIAADNTSSYNYVYLRPTGSGWGASSYAIASETKSLGATIQRSYNNRDFTVPCDGSGQIDYNIDQNLTGTYSSILGLNVVGYYT